MTEWIPEVVAALVALCGWMVAQHRDDAGQPQKHRVRAGTVLAAVGLLLGLLLMPTGMTWRTFALTTVLVLVVGLLLLRGAAVRARGWTSTGEVVTSAVGLALSLSWRHRVALGATTVAGLAVGTWFEGHGQPGAALLAAAVVLAPVRLTLGPARRMERNRTGVEVAMAGVLSGGHEWDAALANSRGAPIKVRFDEGQNPATVTAKVPPGWQASRSDDLAADIEERLSHWGRPWVVRPDHSKRHLRAHLGGLLPEMILYDAPGMPGDSSCRLGSHTVRVGLARVSKAAAKAGKGAEGSLIPFDIDFSKTPHGIIVGQTGGGKSVEDRIIVAQWAARIGEVVLCDPKRVEFLMFQGRKSIRTVATRLPEIMEALAEVEAEMVARTDLIEARRVTNVNRLSDSERPVPWLCAVDEAFELLSKSKASDEETKAENEMRARCARSIQAIVALGRNVDIHMILLAQRADKDVIEGVVQNNTPFRSLMAPAMTGHTERGMIDLRDVAVRENCPGRAVARTLQLPECEMQVAFLDEDDLDRWLPMRRQPEGPPEPSGGPWQPEGPPEPLAGSDEPTGRPGGQTPPEPSGGQTEAEHQARRRDQVFGLTPTRAERQDGPNVGLSDDVWELFTAEPVEPEEAEVGPDGAELVGQHGVRSARTEPVESPKPGQAGSGEATAELVEPSAAELPASIQPESAEPGPAKLDASEWKFLDDPDEDTGPG